MERLELGLGARPGRSSSTVSSPRWSTPMRAPSPSRRPVRREPRHDGAHRPRPVHRQRRGVQRAAMSERPPLTPRQAIILTNRVVASSRLHRERPSDGSKALVEAGAIDASPSTGSRYELAGAGGARPCSAIRTRRSSPSPPTRGWNTACGRRGAVRAAARHGRSAAGRPLGRCAARWTPPLRTTTEMPSRR